MDRGAWWATVHGVAKELDMTLQLSTQHTHTRMHTHIICVEMHIPIAIMKGVCTVQTSSTNGRWALSSLEPCVPRGVSGLLGSVVVISLLHGCFLLLVKSLVIPFFNHTSYKNHQGSTLSF